MELKLLIKLIWFTFTVSVVFAAKATELIFRKTTTTTTESSLADINGTDFSNSSDTGEGTSLKLTGIPQIDYVHDPNLPRELKGYNLSTYPFLDSVPLEEEMDFVCDGLHDGFYASVKFNCQLYHHCLYGIRYDFLCANFTAFDQKTFICHFASEVDCKNSPRYFYRNDALYKQSTTTPVPVTTPSTTTSTTTTTTPPPKVMKVQRPFRRRPVIYDYYYDEYEERPLRPRYRQPVEEVDYDFEDDRIISRRPNNRKRKYYGGRRKAYVDRIPHDYEQYDYTEPEPVKPQNKKKIAVQVSEQKSTSTRDNDEQRKVPTGNNETSRAALFSNRNRNPLRLGIKIRREPLPSVSPATEKTVIEPEIPKDAAALADDEYSYEDYQAGSEEVITPKQTKPAVITERKYTRPSQRRY